MEHTVPVNRVQPVEQHVWLTLVLLSTEADQPPQMQPHLQRVTKRRRDEPPLRREQYWIAQTIKGVTRRIMEIISAWMFPTVRRCDQRLGTSMLTERKR